MYHLSVGGWGGGVGVRYLAHELSDMYTGASLLRTLYMNKPLLYSGCFCRLIILIS